MAYLDEYDHETVVKILLDIIENSEKNEKERKVKKILRSFDFYQKQWTKESSK